MGATRGVSELPQTGTSTVLIADVAERLWENQTLEMTTAVAQLDRTLSDVIAAHGGVRPAEQRDYDGFVVVFGCASDAVACALGLQRAPLGPIRLRIGVHTGDAQLGDEGNDIGPTVIRTARLRDLAHAGQTVLSGTTSDLVLDRLPADAWLTDLGTHSLRDLPRPERVVQLCHTDVSNEFPPLRTPKAGSSQNLPAQLTTFVGRQAEMDELRRIITDNRLVTLTGAGGVGKTRLAVEVAAQLVGEFADGVWYVDLAPITNPLVVPVTVARTLGLADQPGRSTMDTLRRFVGDRKILLLLDDCEHLLDACGALIVALLDACPQLTILATSRELIGVAGELTWGVPSLSLADEAIQLFADRARRARPDFRATDDNSAAIADICRRLDGIPLAIELAAARVRALSLAHIVEHLHDRFRLLTGGARTAVRRHQTLRASVDWSHALLTEPERSLFRRLGVFLGGFDLEAAQAVGASTVVEQYQVIDQLGLLVDKSLVVAEDVSGAMRYRLLETVRQYALEKLGESDEADAVRDRHRDHYTDRAADLVSHMRGGHQRLMDWADVEIDNLRAAFAWSCENADVERALRLASSLQPFWIARGTLPGGIGVVRRRRDRRARPRRGARGLGARGGAPKHPRGVAGGAHQPPGSGAGSIVCRAATRQPRTDRHNAQRMRRAAGRRRPGGIPNLLGRGRRSGPSVQRSEDPVRYPPASSDRSAPCGAIRWAHAQPLRNAAISPTRSATGPRHGAAGYGWGTHCICWAALTRPAESSCDW